MVQNSKNITAMRKFITSILIAAAAMTACVQNDDFVVNNTNDTITLTAHVAAPEVRTTLIGEGNSYHAEWNEGDELNIFEITKNGETLAKKLDKVITAKEDGTTTTFDVELNPTEAESFIYVLTTTDASMNGIATYLGLTLPATQAPAAMDTFDGASDIIVSKKVATPTQPTGINFTTTRLSAIAKVSIKNLALTEGDEVVSVTFDCANYIAGKQTKIYLDDIESGNPFARSEFDTGKSKNITVTLPEAQTDDFTYYMNLWPTTLEAGTTYVVTVVTKDSKFIKSGTIPAEKPLAFTSGNITAITVDMSTAAVDIVAANNYVTVAGIKWATGNLWYDVNGVTETGFVSGWSIAPNQHYCIANSLDGYTTRDVFNFGGINNPFAPSGAATPAEGVNIGGLLFTDAACTTPAGSWADAQYGDIAYWASKGQYRMPTTNEFATLIDEANSVLAQFNGIHGVYFWDPTDGAGRTSTASSSTEIILTKEQLNSGVFFPAIGRGYNTDNSYTVNAAGTTFMYRAGEMEISENWGTNAKEAYYGVVADLKRSGVDRSTANPNQMDIHYWNNAIGAKARLPIRPVVNE